MDVKISDAHEGDYILFIHQFPFSPGKAIKYKTMTCFKIFQKTSFKSLRDTKIGKTNIAGQHLSALLVHVCTKVNRTANKIRNLFMP